MTELIPYPNRTPDDWRRIFTELRQHKIAHAIFMGGEIRQFHDTFNESPQMWGTNWRAACREIIGMDHSAASQYETIYRVLGGDLAPIVRNALPDRAYTLYLIARAVDTDRERVEKAIIDGKIHTAMSQKEAKHFLDETLSIEEEEEEIQEVKEVKEPLAVKGYLDHQMTKVVEKDIVLMARLYGEDFGKLLRMRRDHADLFGVIQKWDSTFEARDVTVLLKMLLHEDEP
jgi:hypothetical protein